MAPLSKQDKNKYRTELMPVNPSTGAHRCDHGRLEQRHHVVCHAVDWLLSERRFPKERPSPRMAMIAMVQTATERAGKVEREKRYYISSAKLGANLLANAVRAHWGIENRPRTLAH